jgi:hypothetical protein
MSKDQTIYTFLRNTIGLIDKLVALKVKGKWLVWDFYLLTSGFELMSLLVPNKDCTTEPSPLGLNIAFKINCFVFFIRTWTLCEQS